MNIPIVTIITTSLIGVISACICPDVMMMNKIIISALWLLGGALVLFGIYGAENKIKPVLKIIGYSSYIIAIGVNVYCFIS